MKCLVSVKQVVDYNVKIEIKADGSGVETEQVKKSMNPFDEIALEEAVLQKEAGLVTEVVVVSIGSRAAIEMLRSALARGADRAILVELGSAETLGKEQELEPINIAFLLQKIVEREQPSLVLMGKQAIDNDCNQTGQMLAGLLGCAQGTFISKLNLKVNANTIEATREIATGLEVIELTLPAVLTADLRLNVPRYLSLHNVMRAKSKPLEIIPVQEFNVHCRARTKVLQILTPPKRMGGVKVSDVAELIEKLIVVEKII